jgi:hypothetical protein
MPAGRQPGGLSDELEPYVDRAEARRFDRVGELLRAARPMPSPGFLTRVTVDTNESPQLWTRVAASLAVGLVLLALALLGASGSGPLGG